MRLNDQAKRYEEMFDSILVQEPFEPIHKISKETLKSLKPDYDVLQYVFVLTIIKNDNFKTYAFVESEKASQILAKLFKKELVKYADDEDIYNEHNDVCAIIIDTYNKVTLWKAEIRSVKIVYS